MWQYKYTKGKSESEFNKQTVEIINKYCKPIYSSLELGAGTGQLSYLIHKINKDYCHIDLIDESPSAVKYILEYFMDKKVIEKRYKVRKENIFSIKNFSFQYQLVFSSGLIEHFKNSNLKELVSIHQKLSYKYVVIIVPADNEENRKFSESEKCKKQYGYEKPMDEKELDFLFINDNFKKIHSERFYKNGKLLIGIYERLQ
jgi:SAM-dependent methyltransferase